MSLYGEYKAGLIDDYLYSALARREELELRDMNDEEEFESEDFFDDDDINEF